ncbi:hypothetical protein GY45DRAFT_1399019 [Cubamyces sp. BRFM 1775]|nr:hypothetical protein GY45DRAFT_1399019 [Cubamyces sp. BRFM 1775]
MLSARITSALASSRAAVRNALRTYASSSGQANGNHIAGGFKATLHNPKVTEEAKERAAACLDEMGVDADRPSSSGGHSPSATKTDTLSTQYLNQVAGGYKAMISNPCTSEDAKQHAREILAAVQAAEAPVDATPEEHHKRVVAGHKAALHSAFSCIPHDCDDTETAFCADPHVSEEAKRHAKEFLWSHDAL